MPLPASLGTSVARAGVLAQRCGWGHFTLWGQLTKSGDIFGCSNWHLVGRGQGLCYASCSTHDSPRHKESSVQMSSVLRLRSSGPGRGDSCKAEVFDVIQTPTLGHSVTHRPQSLNPQNIIMSFNHHPLFTDTETET